MRRHDESDAEDEHSSGKRVGHGVEERRFGSESARTSERESRGSDSVGEGLVVAKSDGGDETEEGGEGKKNDGEDDSVQHCWEGQLPRKFHKR